MNGVIPELKKGSEAWPANAGQLLEELQRAAQRTWLSMAALALLAGTLVACAYSLA